MPVFFRPPFTSQYHFPDPDIRDLPDGIKLIDRPSRILVQMFGRLKIESYFLTDQLTGRKQMVFRMDFREIQGLLVITDDGYDVTTVCRDGARRLHVYESRSHVVTLQLKGIHTAFLVEYKSK